MFTWNLHPTFFQEYMQTIGPKQIFPLHLKQIESHDTEIITNKVCTNKGGCNHQVYFLK